MVHNSLSGNEVGGSAWQIGTLNVTVTGPAAEPPAGPPGGAPVVPLPDLRRCAVALGVPEEAAADAADWIRHTALDDGPERPNPVTGPPDRVAELNRFATHLRFFARPADSFLWHTLYLSTGKVADMYDPLAHLLGEAPRPTERFRRLHRHLAAQQRLRFAPALHLLDEPLPDDTSWLYFHGDFSVTAETHAAMVRAAGIRRWRRSDTAALTAAVFLETDPRAVPVLELEGTIGSRRFTMALSRRYLPYHSGTYGKLAAMASGRQLRMWGFGTLPGDEEAVRPIALGAWPVSFA